MSRAEGPISREIDELIRGAREQWDDAYEAEDLEHANILRRLAVQEELLRDIAIGVRMLIDFTEGPRG